MKETMKGREIQTNTLHQVLLQEGWQSGKSLWLQAWEGMGGKSSQEGRGMRKVKRKGKSSPGRRNCRGEDMGQGL